MIYFHRKLETITKTESYCDVGTLWNQSLPRNSNQEKTKRVLRGETNDNKTDV